MSNDVRAWLLLAPVFFWAGVACTRHDADSADAADEQHEHEAVTVWTDSLEVFLEHPHLTIGEPDEPWVLHLTDLRTFRPISEGVVTFWFADPNGAELVELLSGREHQPDKSVARREAIHAVQVGIAALPDDQREAIRLHVLEGKSLEETAAALNRTPGAVRALAYRAKLQLREAMGSASMWLSGR